jgi:hypothetical protein
METIGTDAATIEVLVVEDCPDGDQCAAAFLYQVSDVDKVFPSRFKELLGNLSRLREHRFLCSFQARVRRASSIRSEDAASVVPMGHACRTRDKAVGALIRCD